MMPQDQGIDSLSPRQARWLYCVLCSRLLPPATSARLCLVLHAGRIAQQWAVSWHVLLACQKSECGTRCTAHLDLFPFCLVAEERIDSELAVAMQRVAASPLCYLCSRPLQSPKQKACADCEGGYHQLYQDLAPAASEPGSKGALLALLRQFSLLKVDPLASFRKHYARLPAFTWDI